jgi:hypothetical protein
MGARAVLVTGGSRGIGAAVLWLASPEAEWASGAILDLNGASYLRSLSAVRTAPTCMMETVPDSTSYRTR